MRVIDKRETLLEKAKKFAPKTRAKSIPVDSLEEIELAIAWARSKVSNAQVSSALGISENSARLSKVFYRMAASLRDGVRRGIIKIVEKS